MAAAAAVVVVGLGVVGLGVVGLGVVVGEGVGVVVGPAGLAL